MERIENAIIRLNLLFLYLNKTIANVRGIARKCDGVITLVIKKYA